MKMKIVPQIPKALEILDSVIKDAYCSDNPDDVLTRAYFSMLEVIRLYACTGNNVEKFSEFFYFRYVKYFLEKKLNEDGLKVEFKEEKLKGVKTTFLTFEHNEKELILKSDLTVKEAGIISKKPDIFVGVKENEYTIRPIAIFEIKIYQDKEEQINKLIERFKQLKESVVAKFPNMTGENLPFFIWIYLDHALHDNLDFTEKIKEFQKLSDNNHLVVINNVTRWYESTFTGGINAIMEKIIKKIRAYNYF